MDNLPMHVHLPPLPQHAQDQDRWAIWGRGWLITFRLSWVTWRKRPPVRNQEALQRRVGKREKKMGMGKRKRGEERRLQDQNKQHAYLLVSLGVFSVIYKWDRLIDPFLTTQGLSLFQDNSDVHTRTHWALLWPAWGAISGPRTLQISVSAG